MLISPTLKKNIETQIKPFAESQLHTLVKKYGNYVVKFVNSKWADHYTTQKPLKISEAPALTWGTATYVTPLAFTLSSALYGRIGLVTTYDPSNWKIFDATIAANRMLYLKWIQLQPAFETLTNTVHSTIANHELRNKFRKDFNIDCVLFHPDQEAEYYTNSSQHIWMAVTDWTTDGAIESNFSQRLSQARFTILVDEDFVLKDGKWDLPVSKSPRQIEKAAQALHSIRQTRPIALSTARTTTGLSQEVIDRYVQGGYLHVYIEP